LLSFNVGGVGVDTGRTDAVAAVDDAAVDDAAVEVTGAEIAGAEELEAECDCDVCGRARVSIRPTKSEEPEPFLLLDILGATFDVTKV